MIHEHLDSIQYRMEVDSRLKRVQMESALLKRKQLAQKRRERRISITAGLWSVFGALIAVGALGVAKPIVFLISLALLSICSYITLQ